MAVSGARDRFEGSLAIAIVGMAARFPGARTVDEFWENLCSGKDTIHVFTDDELERAGVTRAEMDDPAYVKAAPIIQDIDRFDAAFFDYTPAEASFMDPQQRLLLECTWEALESAGYTGERDSNSIGVFAGIKMNTYVGSFFANDDLLTPTDRLQVMLGNAEFSLGTRISFKLGLEGPSYMVQTACSTSLAAVHLACQALLLDECSMALAGAVAIEVPHEVGYHYVPGGPASPDGQCRPFDAAARGTVFGSGLGMVALKRLEDALADDDHIYAVIRGTAVNNDGSLKASFTAPSVQGQMRVIMEALACANVDASSISYVEAHGTGTPLGDPIEIQALTNVFHAGTREEGSCRIGSVKSNVGHLDAAAGMAGLVKTILALSHKQIPPSLHFRQPNPEIDFAGGPFVVNTDLTEWDGVPLPRRAGVSSFGFGGTNTHVVLEEAPPLERSGPSRACQLLVLSAKTSTALDAATSNLASHLRQNPDLDLPDVAFTLHVGRPAFKHRRTLVCRNVTEAVELLEAKDDPRVLTAVQETGDRPVAFMFPGQGAQYVHMGGELYEGEPVFRENVDRCAGILAPHLGLDLRTVLFPSPGEEEEAALKLTQTVTTQPALFAVEYALARLWQSWGITPRAMIGHSIGEYVAACLAGVFTLEGGLALVAARGRLMQQMPPGAMLGVALSEQELQPFLGEQVSLAGVNSPGRCVVSGPGEAVDELEKRLTEKGTSCRRLHTSHAFHSAMMDPILEPFADQFEGVALSPPQLPYVSNVSGTWIEEAEATSPRYWADHLRRTVRFSEGVGKILENPDLVLLEVGPGRVLGTLARRCMGRGSQQIILPSLRHPKDEDSDLAFLLNTLGQLWLAGVKVDWRGYYVNERRHRIPLPTYPFERRRYWFEPPRDKTRGGRQGTSQATKKPDVAGWFYAPSWKRVPTPVCEGRKDAGLPSCLLLFADECGLGERLQERLVQEGHDAITVHAGRTFARTGDRRFTLNPAHPEDYDALLDDLQTAGQLPEGVIHLWSVTRDDGEGAIEERVAQAQNLGFYSLLSLVQALGKQGLTDDPGNEVGLTVVSNGVQEVTGEERLRPEKATLLGPVKVVPLEYPGVTCRSVDVVLCPPGDDGVEDLAGLLLAEATSGSRALTVAFRGKHRWEGTLEPVRLEDPGETARPEEGSTYLITGGLGGIGLVLAEHLAQSAKVNLVLTGRSAIPERDERESWLATHGEEDVTSARIRAVQTLEELGADVMVAAADVTDLEQMHAVVAGACERFGTIDRVLHTAGVPGGGIIQLKTPEMASGVLAPKVTGTLVLEQVLADVQPAQVVLFSSLSAVMGEFGQADYCGANAFLDAFAHQNRGTVTAISWDIWQEVGMTVRTSVPDAVKEWREEQLALGMLSSEGVDVYRRALASGLPQVVVCTMDVEARTEQFRSLTRSRILGAVDQLLPSPGAVHPRPEMRTPYLAPRNDLERTVAAIWQDVLGIERVGIHDSFFELGGDSLVGLKLIAQVQKQLQVEIPAVDLYKGPTVSRLADMVEQLTGRVEDDGAAQDMGRRRGELRLERRRRQGGRPARSPTPADER